MAFARPSSSMVRRPDAAWISRASARASTRRSIVFVDDQQLEHGDPAGKAGMAARGTSDRPIETLDRAGSDGRRRAPRTSRPVGVKGSRQWAHSRRTRRWASTAFNVEVIRNGSTPMSIRRVTAAAALLVCRVERMVWPVSAACTATWAVSRSRISPTIITSGSWRRNERRAAAKVRPIWLLTCVWLMPARRYSIGSSMVRILRSAVLSAASEA